MRHVHVGRMQDARKEEASGKAWRREEDRRGSVARDPIGVIDRTATAQAKAEREGRACMWGIERAEREGRWSAQQ